MPGTLGFGRSHGEDVDPMAVVGAASAVADKCNSWRRRLAWRRVAAGSPARRARRARRERIRENQSAQTRRLSM
eukprot:scaffold307583_cov32-Tisochrysis_lutea.AAC.4